MSVVTSKPRIQPGLFGLMSPLAAIFQLAVVTRNLLYDRRLLPARRLQGPVISIGNLSVGGSGKTPFVILLGKLLNERGVRFDVLSRGYGRSRQAMLEVNPGGLPVDFGDEPLLIARQLGVPVIVGEDRYEAGAYAEKKFGPQLHLLDDGFQHRALARDFDIVLLPAEDAGDRMLPAGRLREPVSSLRRTHAVVLSSALPAESLPVEDKLIWRVRRGITLKNVPPHPVAFCGIARPRNFLLELRAQGVELAAEAVFRDHHRYREQDVRQLLHLKVRSDAGGFVTTEKDAVNLGGYLSALEPVAVIPVRMDLANATDVLDTMLRMIAESRRKHEKIGDARL